MGSTIYLVLVLTGLVLAGIPFVMIWRNRSAYRPPPSPPAATRLPAVSVLIPARNEAANIRAAVESVLANCGVEFEVVVLDDGSEDETAAIVQTLAIEDRRVRLERAPALPPGWCGKQHACQVLAGLARFPLLAFLDADVRLTPDALARMAAFVERTGADLASGIPRQVTVTWAEKLLLPLIQFVLLGYLPIRRMRKRREPAYGAGCGQLFIARASAYAAAGGHRAIRNSLHDGLKLPRAFRRAGFRTDLFDATDLAACRMYSDARAVWSGLSKNATEGLASNRMILGSTILLIGGHVMPWVLLGLGLAAGQPAWPLALLGGLLSVWPRLWAARWFNQPLAWALLHPVAVSLFMIIQWTAWWRAARGRTAEWKGRAYPAADVQQEASQPTAAGGPNNL